MKKVNFIALAGALLISALPAQAASMSYFLTLSNDLEDGINYAQVTISDSTDVSGDIDFSVQVLADAFPEEFSNFGMQDFYFNYEEGLSLSTDNIINVDPDWSAQVGSANAGGSFGNYDVKLAGRGSNRTELLTFSITGIAGDTIESYALGADLMNGSGEYFASHIAGYNSDLTGNTSGKFAGGDVVPIPASAWLMGSGLGLLGWMRIRKNKAELAEV